MGCRIPKDSSFLSVNLQYIFRLLANLQCTISACQGSSFSFSATVIIFFGGKSGLAPPKISLIYVPADHDLTNSADLCIPF